MKQRCYSARSWQTKAWHESTGYTWQIMLTKHVQTTSRSMAYIKKNRVGSKQIHDAYLEATKVYATGTIPGKQEHGIHVPNALNKTSSLNMFQKPLDMMIASMQNDKLYKQFQTW